MKVRIIRSGWQEWYTNQEGRVLEVELYTPEFHSPQMYKCTNLKDRYILKDDCEIIKETECCFTFKDEFCNYKGNCPSCDKSFEMCRFIGNQEMFGNFHTPIIKKYAKEIVDELFRPNIYCDECRHLNYTEEEQDELVKRRRLYTCHYCKKYLRKVRHENQHPKILRCKECLNEKV